MRKIYLPELISIKVENFSLYKEDIEYNFVKGVNLIIGGNGVGKTTFINLIKYSILGHYVAKSKAKTYKEKKIERRQHLAYNYFSKRMKDDYEKNENATVKSVFVINNTEFTVLRSLKNLRVLEVMIKEGNYSFYLEGEIISQEKYDRLSDIEDKKHYLQYILENYMAEKSNRKVFDDLIFFINDILYFEENRNTILWDDEIQDDLANKYLNDPEIDEKREEAKRQMTYHDSVARHQTVAIRTLSNVFNKMKPEEEVNKTYDALSSINKSEKEIEKINNNLEAIQYKRKKNESELKILQADQTKKISQIQEIEKNIKSINESMFDEIFGGLHEQYESFQKTLSDLCICPMCNNSLSQEVVDEMIITSDNCILCKEPILELSTEPTEIKRIKEDLEKSLSELRNIEKNLITLENSLKDLDLEYNKNTHKLFKTQSKLRSLQHNNYLENKHDDIDTSTSAYTTMYYEIEERKKIRESHQQKSKVFKNIAEDISLEIEKNLTNLTRDLSNMFSELAEGFLGSKAYLSLDNFKGHKIKKFIPVISGILRQEEEELSESQRFFIDQSFRLSVLKYFYNTPTIFVCETPDSSLDISYEENAANIYLKFLENPNTLILTSNLNNSEFLDIIIRKAPEINYLNLLKLGNSSEVQKNNEKLMRISNEIEAKINAK